MVLIHSVIISSIGSLSGNGGMVILENTEESNARFVVRGKTERNCVTLIHLAEPECLLWPIRASLNIPVLLLPSVSATCCFLSHHLVSLTTFTSPSRGDILMMSLLLIKKLIHLWWCCGPWRKHFPMRGSEAHVKWCRALPPMDPFSHWLCGIPFSPSSWHLTFLPPAPQLPSLLWVLAPLIGYFLLYNKTQMFGPVYSCTSFPHPHILQHASTMSFLNKQYSSRISLIWFPLLHLCQNHTCQNFQWLLITNKGVPFPMLNWVSIHQ